MILPEKDFLFCAIAQETATCSCKPRGESCHAPGIMHEYTQCVTPSAGTRRLFETRRLLPISLKLDRAYKPGRRLFQGGFYSRIYGIYTYICMYIDISNVCLKVFNIHNCTLTETSLQVMNKRTHLTNYQLQKLQEGYQANPYPHRSERRRLAMSLNMREPQVEAWFRHRRSYERSIGLLSQSESMLINIQ